MKRKFFFLIFVVGGVLVLTAFLSLNNEKSAKTASLKDTSDPLQNKEETVYSFYQDDDLDGLCNAKEKIYGSSPKIADTDGDGYLDGEEVENGYDPIQAGKARLEQRNNLSVTIQYFIWARQQKGIQNPRIEKNLLDEFSKNRPEFISLRETADEEINLISQNDKEAVRRYLSELNKISLPEGVVTYRKIAENYNQNSLSLLQDLLAKIELAYLDFKYLETPPVAKEIQRGYLTVVKEFSSIFADLEYYQLNPVKIELNLKKAQKLIELSQKIEAQKLELIQEYKIS